MPNILCSPTFHYGILISFWETFSSSVHYRTKCEVKHDILLQSAWSTDNRWYSWDDNCDGHYRIQGDWCKYGNQINHPVAR